MRVGRDGLLSIVYPESAIVAKVSDREKRQVVQAQLEVTWHLREFV